MRIAAVLALVSATLVAARAGGAAAPAFQLVFEGSHDDRPLHLGPFTTSASWCASGTAADVEVDESTFTALRKFSCGGGGEFVAKVTPLPAEHGGSGTWRIVSGTGPLADLRGQGTFTSTRLTGSAGDPASITFRSDWVGVADFDSTPPAFSIARSNVRKLKRPGTYALAVTISAADADQGSYTLRVVAPRARLVGLKEGRISGQTATAGVRIAVAKTLRAVRIELTVRDAVGNETVHARTVRLR